MTSIQKKVPKKKVVQPQVQSNDENLLISEELERFTKQVHEMLSSLESINLLTIEDPEERLKNTKIKLEIELKLPQLLGSLDDLRNKNKLKTGDIKGNRSLSPLEDGTLDD